MGAYECYRLRSGGVELLDPAGVTATGLPSALVCPPGVYSSGYYGGIGWDMRVPGLHALVRWPQSAIDTGYANYRIIRGDPLEACAAVAYLCAHGTSDEKMFRPRADLSVDWTTILGELGTRGFSLLCGNTCALAAKVLSLAGFLDGRDYRTVRLVTSGPPNNIDDGHVGLEIKQGGGWVFVDLTFDRVFDDDSTGAPYASLDSLVQMASPVPVKIAKDFWGHRQYSDGETTGFPSHAYHLTFDDVAWRNRVWHVPGIVQNGATYCWIPPARDSAATRLYVTGLGYQIVDRETWLRFYA